MLYVCKNFKIMGRQKITPDKKRETICIRLKQEDLTLLQKIADDRLISMTKIIEKCLLTTTTLFDLK